MLGEGGGCSGAANGAAMEGSVYSEGRPTPVGNGAAAFVTDTQSRTVLGWAGSGSFPWALGKI